VSWVWYLDLADFLLIAEAVLGVDAAELTLTTRLDLAESALASPSAAFEEHEFYPEFSQKAAALCYHLVKNHALLDGNKRVSYLCLVEFAERNGYQWVAPPADGKSGRETAEVIERVADGSMAQTTLEAWVAERITKKT
jgi:death-on-curing protein